MKIAIIFDEIKDSGGFVQSLSSLMQITQVQKESKNFTFIYICTSKNTKAVLREHNVHLEIFKKSKISKLFNILNEISLLKLLFNKLNITNPFTNFLKKRKIDLVIFLGPSQLILSCHGINFIMSVYDIGFKINHFFPEYRKKYIYEIREKIVHKSSLHAFRILVDTLKTKNMICKIYNCLEENVIVQHFSPLLIKEYYLENLKKLNISNKILNLKNYIYYPAQFWAHKNHKYIVEAVNSLKKNHNINLNVVFCGKDKGNLEYVNELISKLNITDQFAILGYINDHEILHLYKNCNALVMPTYVATSTLPLYEAFYYKVPVLYSAGVLDPNLENFVTTFDLKNFNELTLILKKMYENRLETENKIKNGYEFCKKFCNDKYLSSNYKKILNDYHLIKEIWKSDYN